MEEIYIVKLKGLPPPLGTSHESVSKDSKNSFYYHQDLTAEAIRGFSYLHIFFGVTVLCLSVTNLCFHENPLALEPPLGITVWCGSAFILLGVFGILTAYKRTCDLSRSIFFVKILFLIVIAVLSLTFTFVILFAFDLHGPIANHLIGLNIFFSITVETVILLLTLFTCARILWPGCLSFCAKDWPMQPKLKRKVIVKTNVFASGIQQDDSSLIQSVGPNCVISLNMPPLASESVHTSSSPSPICIKEMPSRFAPSELTNSSSSLYSSDNQRQGHLPSVTAGSNTCPIYGHSGLSLTNSYPLTALPPTSSNSAHMQTFRKDPNSQKPSSSQLYGNVNRLLYEHSNIFKMRRSCSFSRQLSSAHSESEEVDPYDTDEFDYCSTDEDADQETIDRRLNLEDCQKSSSDEGNGTIEEDNKSSVNSDALSPSQSEADLSAVDSYLNLRSISECDADPRYPPSRLKEATDTVIEITSPCQEHSQSVLPPSTIPETASESESVDDNQGGLHSPTDRLSEDDEGIASSGSSTCSADLSPLESSPFSKRLRLQACRSKQPYKSSIKIEANPTTTTTTSSPAQRGLSPTCPSNGLNHVTTVSTHGDGPEKGEAVLAVTNDPTTPTIRMLTTKVTPSQPKQKLRIDLTGSNTGSPSSCGPKSKVTTSLSTHPYLCRLRASNVDCFERRYPKYPLNSSAGATTPSSTPPTTPTALTQAPTNLTVNYYEPNRIPDIQGV